MALVHSPFIHPPRLKKLAQTKFTDDLVAICERVGLADAA